LIGCASEPNFALAHKEVDMSINLTVPSNMETPDLRPRITVVGVGGGGGNAVNNMIRRELGGVDFVVANTDAQSLARSSAERRIQIGASLTEGLGAGSKPEIGRSAVEESIDAVLEELSGSHMVFIAAGMGGGTGTGAAPVIARVAKDAGMLTIGVVTKPFQFEGTHRMRLAEAGIEELEQYVDSLIIIPNQNLFRIANEHTTFADAFSMADEVLYSGVRGVTDLMVMPGLMNLDFADVRSVMSEMGKAMMGTGEATGDRRALDAAEAAIANPLLDDTTMRGAKGVLINITGGPDITLFEVDEAASRIREEVDQDAYIIFGSAFDSSLEGSIRVSVIATGINAGMAAQPQPTMLSLSAAPASYRTRTTETAQPATPSILEVTEQATAEADEAEPTEEVLDGIDAAETAEAVEVAEPAEAAIELADSGDEEPVMEEPVAEDEEIEPESEIEGNEKTETPPAEPGAGGATDAFIPPRPAISEGPAEQPQAEPFAAAAMTNGGREPGAVSGDQGEAAAKPSLFERVTRTGRAAVSVVVGDDTPEPLEVMENKEISATNQVLDSRPEPLEVATEMESSEKVSEDQVDMTGLEAEEDIAVDITEEDILDIPAFLRRQAN
jgi:cell division protein FtsZ